jgi:enoyl-[acyl-carrier protein] reductase I
MDALADRPRLKNRKSVAWHVGRKLGEAGASVIWSVHTHERATEVRKLLPNAEILVCDVEDETQIADLARSLGERRLDGMVHSIAFASYTPKPDDTARAFHEVTRADFLRATDVSCFSLIALSNALKPHLVERASVVTISISTTRMASSMAPIKAALDSAVTSPRWPCASGFLRQSVRRRDPGYLDNYCRGSRDAAQAGTAEKCPSSPRSASTRKVRTRGG